VSLLVCNEKILFWVSGFFVGDTISGVGFKPFWLRLPGPGPQLQEENISLKFSVVTRLKSKSFEPLNSSLLLSAPELRVRKAMCETVVLGWKSLKSAGCESVNIITRIVLLFAIKYKFTTLWENSRAKPRVFRCFFLKSPISARCQSVKIVFTSNVEKIRN